MNSQSHRRVVQFWLRGQGSELARGTDDAARPLSSRCPLWRNRWTWNTSQPHRLLSGSDHRHRLAARAGKAPCSIPEQTQTIITETPLLSSYLPPSSRTAASGRNRHQRTPTTTTYTARLKPNGRTKVRHNSISHTNPSFRNPRYKKIASNN